MAELPALAQPAHGKLRLQHSNCFSILKPSAQKSESSEVRKIDGKPALEVQEQGLELPRQEAPSPGPLAPLAFSEQQNGLSGAAPARVPGPSQQGLAPVSEQLLWRRVPLELAPQQVLRQGVLRQPVQQPELLVRVPGQVLQPWRRTPSSCYMKW